MRQAPFRESSRIDIPDAVRVYDGGNITPGPLPTTRQQKECRCPKLSRQRDSPVQVARDSPVQVAAHAGEVTTVGQEGHRKGEVGGVLPLVAAPTVLFGGKQANTAPGTLLQPPLDEGHDPSLFQVPPPPIIGRSGGSLPCSEISVDWARK